MKRKLSLLAFVTMLVLSLLTISCGDETRVASTGGAPSDEMNAGSTAMRVDVIDVGKGDCILVRSGGSSMLIDTGYDDTSDQVISYLHEQGVEHLAALVLTHYDKDHVGGFRDIAASLGADTVYLPGYRGADKNYKSTIKVVDDLGLSARPVAQEETFALGEARIALHPSGVAYVPGANGDEGNDNDASLVATLTHGKDSYLFTGDLEKEGVEAYLRQAHGTFDVIKMPHHGEKGGNVDELIADVQPQIALITDSVDDPADKKTLKLLAKEGVEAYRTSTEGTIVVESDGTGSYVVTVG